MSYSSREEAYISAGTVLAMSLDASFLWCERRKLPYCAT